MSRRSDLRLVVLVALVIATIAAVRLLAVSEWDPTAFTAFGEDAVEITAYAEGHLGREVLTRDLQGHDGKFFFVQANDPLILEPEKNAAVLDRPVYRSQRMFYPLIAGGVGLFSPNLIVWALVVINIVGLAVGSWAIGSIATKHGASPWWGLAFILNGGLLSELYIDGAGVLAFALACVGVLALEEKRPGIAAALFVAAALTREAMLSFIGLVALFWMIRKKAIPWLLAVPAGVTALLWGLYVRAQIDLPTASDQVREITLIPFSGLIEAVTSGIAQVEDYLLMLIFVFLLVLVPVRAWKSEVYLTWGAVGFAVLAPFLTIYVWQKSFDISRALAPLVTAFLIEFAIARRQKMQTAAM